MNRRNFLKKLGVACGVAVACPGELLRPKTKLEDLQVPSDVGLKQWSKYYAKHKGVSNKDLKDLIEATLKDLPKISFRGVPLHYYEEFPI